MKEIQAKYDVPNFFGQIMYWCYRWGCEIELTNKAWREPWRFGKGPHMVNETFEKQRDGSLVDLDASFRVKEIEIPELRFRKGDKYKLIYAHDWPSLMECLRHQYKSIFMELSVPYFNPFKEEK